MPHQPQEKSLRRLVLGVLLLCATFLGTAGASATGVQSALAIDDPRLDPALREMLVTGRPNPDIVRPATAGLGVEAAGGSPIEVIVRGAVRAADLAAAGAQVQTEAGTVTTVLVALGAVPNLLAVDGVEEVAAPRPLELLLDKSVLDIDATTLWGGTPPSYPGYSGQNVIIGIVDTGLDLTHPDFRTSQDKTRVKYAWDQTLVGVPPAGFSTGVEYTEAQINAGTVPSTDNNGHGTHIAGVAAGNGRATGNGYPSYRYVGIAPEADLIVVKSLLYDADVIDGVRYIFQKAASLGKDAVVLLAVGNQVGGHDGTANLDVAISALTGPGKLVAAAAGNNRGQAIHAKVNLASGASTSISFTIPTYTPNSGVTEYLEVEGWHEPTASFKVKLTGPAGGTSDWRDPNTYSGLVPTADGTLMVWNAQVTNPKGAKQIRFRIVDAGDGHPPAAGTWRIDVQRVSGTTGILDAWVSVYLFASASGPPVFTTQVDLTTLVLSPATGDSVISAGAYTTKLAWTNVSGQPSSLPGTLWDLASFSSPGPRRDGKQRPDIAAPGNGVAAALSTPVSPRASNVLKTEDGVHWVRTGTSVAAAHVAGALALLLELTPHLTPSAARASLQARAQRDSYTGPSPTGSWGAGKLNLVMSEVPVEETGAVRFGMAPAYPNPSRGEATFDFALTAGDLASGPVGVRLRILDVRGREVATVPGQAVEGRQRLIWNGKTSAGKLAPTGIYLGRLEVGSQHAIRKFVRLP